MYNFGYSKNGKWCLLYAEMYILESAAVDRERKLKQFGNVWYGVMQRAKK
jgi:uncharacterized protein YlbG (UPF0298 family)